MKKTVLFILVLLTLLGLSSCGNSSSSELHDANLSAEHPPMFPGWNGEVPQ